MTRLLARVAIACTLAGFLAACGADPPAPQLVRACHDGTQLLRNGAAYVLRSKPNQWVGSYDTPVAPEAKLAEVCP